MMILPNQAVHCKWCGKKFIPCVTGDMNEFEVAKATMTCSDKCAAWCLVEKKMRNLSILPTKYINIRLETFSDKRKEITENIIFHRKNAYFWGKPGTGKTVMACTCAKYIFHQTLLRDWEANPKKYIKYISFPEFIVELQCTYSQDGKSPYQYLQEIAKFPELLIMDDLGAEKLTEFVRQTIYHIINTREQWELQTIITSNFSLEQIAEQIDQRIASRIAGMCQVVEFTGQDQRIKKAIKRRK